MFFHDLIYRFAVGRVAGCGTTLYSALKRVLVGIVHYIDLIEFLSAVEGIEDSENGDGGSG